MGRSATNYGGMRGGGEAAGVVGGQVGVRGVGGQVGGDQAGQVRGEGHAAVGDRDVQARGTGDAAHDGLAVGGQRADADLELHDLGVVQAADRAAGAAEEFGGPAAQFRLGSVQVDGGVRGLQVQQAAGMG